MCYGEAFPARLGRSRKTLCFHSGRSRMCTPRWPSQTGGPTCRYLRQSLCLLSDNKGAACLNLISVCLWLGKVREGLHRRESRTAVPPRPGCMARGPTRSPPAGRCRPCWRSTSTQTPAFRHHVTLRCSRYAFVDLIPRLKGIRCVAASSTASHLLSGTKTVGVGPQRQPQKALSARAQPAALHE